MFSSHNAMILKATNKGIKIGPPYIWKRRSTLLYNSWMKEKFSIDFILINFSVQIPAEMRKMKMTQKEADEMRIGLSTYHAKANACSQVYRHMNCTPDNNDFFLQLYGD